MEQRQGPAKSHDQVVNPRSRILNHKILVHLANQIDFQVKNAFFGDKLNPGCSSYGSPGK